MKPWCPPPSWPQHTCTLDASCLTPWSSLHTYSFQAVSGSLCIAGGSGAEILDQRLQRAPFKSEAVGSHGRLLSRKRCGQSQPLGRCLWPWWKVGGDCQAGRPAEQGGGGAGCLDQHLVSPSSILTVSSYRLEVPLQDFCTEGAQCDCRPWP